MCAQKRPLLLYVEFVRALLATRDTLVPSAMFNATGHAQQDEIMGWAWDKTTDSMRTAEDIMAVALAALAGQVVHRGDKKFRKFLAGVFNDGASQDVFAALGLASAGDQAWPEVLVPNTVPNTASSLPRCESVTFTNGEITT